MNNIEIHPAYNGFEQNINNLKGGFLPSKSKIIIMGTFPPKIDYTEIKPFFYYPSSRNRFWNIIDKILNNKCPLKYTKKTEKNETRINNINRKIKFTLNNNKRIAFLDFYSKIKRNKNTSNDSDLIEIENVVDNGFLFNFLKVNKIKLILCTYSKAYKKLVSSLKKSLKVIVNEEKKYSIFTFNNNPIKIIQLFPATFRGPKEEKKVKQYKHYILD